MVKNHQPTTVLPTILTPHGLAPFHPEARFTAKIRMNIWKNNLSLAASTVAE
jgi:hypothetical protein